MGDSDDDEKDFEGFEPEELYAPRDFDFILLPLRKLRKFSKLVQFTLDVLVNNHSSNTSLSFMVSIIYKIL